MAAAEEGIGAKTLRRGLAAVQAAEEAGVDAVARARELEAVLSEFAQPDVETVSLDACDDDATTDDNDADGADPAAVIDRIRAADAEFCKRTGVSIDTLRREQARVRRR